MACVSARAFVTRSWRRWETLGLAVSFALIGAFLYFASFDRAAPSPRANLLWKAAMLSLVVTGGMVWYARAFSESKPKDAKVDEQSPEPLPRQRPIPGWKPQSPPITLTDSPHPFARHRVVVVHVWATWNGHDRRMDEQLQLVRDEFAPDIGVYALDYDPEPNWDFLREHNIISIPALVVLTDGKRIEVVLGAQPADVLRAKFRQWLAETDAAPGAE